MRDYSRIQSAPTHAIPSIHQLIQILIIDEILYTVNLDPAGPGLLGSQEIRRTRKTFYPRCLEKHNTNVFAEARRRRAQTSKDECTVLETRRSIDYAQ